MKKLRFLSVVYALVLVLTATGCGEQPEPNEGSSDSVNTTTSTTAASTTTTADGGTTTGDTTTTTGESTVAAQDTTNKPTASVTTKKSTTKKTTTKSTVKSTTNKTTKQEAPKMDWTKYNLDCFISPIWYGNTVYNETIMFVPKDSKGTLDAAPLLYQPEEVLEVRSYDLKKVYKAGVDYTVTKDGRIQLTENTSIPVWKYDDYYLKKPEGSVSIGSISQKGRYLKYGEGTTFTRYQLCVTYTHKGKWSGYRPEYAGNILKHTVEKLQKGEPLKVVFNGDSIAEGCNASAFVGTDPKVPTWTNMVIEALKAEYTSKITSVNTAVGGTTAQWGANNVQDNLVKHNPDLVILRFGGNDGTQGVSAKNFKKFYKWMIDKVRAKNPKCEFILVSTTKCNPDADGWTKTHDLYNAVENELAQEYEGVAVVNMTAMEAKMLETKRYFDMTGNNINHISDFMVRVQASAVAQLLIEEL